MIMRGIGRDRQDIDDLDPARSILIREALTCSLTLMRMGRGGRLVNPVVLVLDDDPGILDEVCETLSDEGIGALRAESGAELWAHAEKHSIDLFILDLVLPEESGLSIAKTIRERSDVGIIIVTRKSAEADRVVGLEIGADDYITKPFSARELVARVRSVLRRTKGNVYPGSGKGSGGDHRIAEFSGWEFDLTARQLLNPKAPRST